MEGIRTMNLEQLKKAADDAKAAYYNAATDDDTLRQQAVQAILAYGAASFGMRWPADFDGAHHVAGEK
jgi:hypothetical protein